MTDQFSINNIDSLLLQLVCRADIAERRSYIETNRRNIKELEEEIRVKQSTVTHNKANAESLRVTNSQLLQYEQALKEELESRKASYNRDKEVYEERIASYKKIFQSHKGYYCQNPLAQKLLTLQAEIEKIESRIKACDDQITMKQKELDSLTEQRCQHVMHSEEQDQETAPEDQASEQWRSTVSDMEEAVEQEEMEESGAVAEEQAPSKEDGEGLTAFPHRSSQETNPESSPATVNAVTSTPMFPFSFSPGSSPHQETSDTKSPAFLFSLNSGPSTPSFSGFGFDVGSPQDEKTTELKSSSSEFPFGQPEQNEDFQFAFNAKNPQTANKDNTRDDFPFSFNF
ncbi:uncharacterized protein ABDE67_011166 [Symphorus nematophorus]